MVDRLKGFRKSLIWHSLNEREEVRSGRRPKTYDSCDLKVEDPHQTRVTDSV